MYIAVPSSWHHDCIPPVIKTYQNHVHTGPLWDPHAVTDGSRMICQDRSEDSEPGLPWRNDQLSGVEPGVCVCVCVCVCVRVRAPYAMPAECHKG